MDERVVGRGTTARSVERSDLHLVHYLESFGCHMDQGAGIGVFQHPQRAIGALFHIADAVADIPALGGFGAAMAIKDDADKRLGRHAADEAAAGPLWEGFG